MNALVSKPAGTNTNPPRIVQQPAFWALGLSRDGVLYAKAFQDHWNACYYKDAYYKNSDMERVAVTKYKTTWDKVIRLLDWEYGQVVHNL